MDLRAFMSQATTSGEALPAPETQAERWIKYGGQVKKYETFSKTFGDKYKQIADMATAEQKEVRALMATPNLPDTVQEFLQSIFLSFRNVKDQLEQDQAAAQQFLKAKPVDY